MKKLFLLAPMAMICLPPPVSGAPAPLGQVRAGASAVSITPAAGIGLAGYYHGRLADGIHDDLHAKSLVLEKDGTKVALVSLDLLSTTRSMVDAARKEIERTSRIPGSHVMISATHAHTAPVLAEIKRPDVVESSQDAISQYSARLPILIAESVRRAAENLVPVQVSAGTGRADGLSFNRRFHLRDGTVRTNPGKMNPEVLRTTGPTDAEVPVVYLEGMGGKPLATYVNFAMHLDTVGGNKFSADYPYTLAKILADAKGSDMVTVFTAGTSGDTNHLDVTSNRPQKGHGEGARIGSILASSVLRAFEQLETVNPHGLRAVHTMVKLPLSGVTPAELAAARKTIAQSKDTAKQTPPFFDLVTAYRTTDVADRKGRPFEVEVQVIALGDQLAWVSLPGEIFVELGLAIKRSSPFKHTIITQLANGSIGYVPTRVAYPQQGYEVVSARCAAGSGEMLVDAALDLLRKAYKPAAARHASAQ